MNDFKKYLSQTKEFGIVKSVEHPIIRVEGLPSAKIDELVLFEDGQLGHVSALLSNSVEVVSYAKLPIQPGSRVTRTDQTLSISISEKLLGKVVNPMMIPLFNYKGYDFEGSEVRGVDVLPPLLKTRVRIKRQLITGVTIIDSIIPLGKGQRELIVGDRKTGKTSTILNIIKTQVGEGTIVIYAAIGKEKSDTKRLKDYLEKKGLMKNTIIVATSSDDPSSLIDLAPYSAATVSEYFRDRGKDVLLIYDDLTTHAKYYREMSLLGRRFPGRDSYPGDIFYKHARLLERAGNFISDNKNKEVSITALVLAETMNTSMTDYVVSNLISITDGHIRFDTELFNQGRRPAVDIFLSVTRIGKQTQNQISRRMTLDLMHLMSKHDKSSNFKHFGAELTDEIKLLIQKGDMVFAFFDQSYQRSFPLNVQNIFLALILADKLTDFGYQDIKRMKKTLYHLYKKPQPRKYLDDIANVSTYEEFIDRINIEADNLIQLCQEVQN